MFDLDTIVHRNQQGEPAYVALAHRRYHLLVPAFWRDVCPWCEQIANEQENQRGRETRDSSGASDQEPA